VNSLVKGNITFEQFEQDIANGLMGAKHDLFDKASAPVNILTCVGHSDKFVDAELFGEKKEMLQDLYGCPRRRPSLLTRSLDEHRFRLMTTRQEPSSRDSRTNDSEIVASF
jgi:hypothetical protein